MTASGQNVEMYQGDDKILHVTVTDSDGAVQSLVGYKAYYYIYKPTNPKNIVISKTTVSGIIITNPTGGILEIYIDQFETLGISYGYYQHLCKVADTDGEISTIFTGKFTILDGV